jgi:hypothetical protein
MPGDIRTWHAPNREPIGRMSDRMPPELKEALAKPEPARPGAPSQKPGAQSAQKPPMPSSQGPPVSRPAQSPREADGFLHEFVGREVTVYLLAPLGKATGPILTGRLRLVRKYEALLDRPDGPVVLMKAGIAAVAPQPADAANDAPA